MADGNRENSGARDADLENRSRKLDEALARRKSDDGGEEREKARSEQAHGFAKALRLSSEFIAGIVVGGVIGWLIDRAFGTSPWGLIVFFLLGFCAGVLNVLRSAGLIAYRRGMAPDGDGQ